MFLLKTLLHSIPLIFLNLNMFVYFSYTILFFIYSKIRIIPLIQLTFYLAARKLRVYVFIKFSNNLAQISGIITTNIALKYYMLTLHFTVN